MQIGQALSIRKKYRIAIWTWFIGGSALLLASLYLTDYFLVLLLALFGSIGIYVLGLKCPICNKRVLRNPARILGKEFYIWTPWIPRKCTQCGKEL